MRAGTAKGEATLGGLVHDYVRTQCDVLRDLRTRIADRDESAVHPARVAIRRLRATLQTFAAVYDAEVASAFGEELRWAGILLGEVRDLQVLAARFADAEAGASDAARRALEPELDRDRAQAWERVALGLGSARGAAFYDAIDRWRDAPPFTAEAERPASRAGRAVAKADARVRTRLARAEAAADAPAEEAAVLLHAARKAVKRHRYAVELALPVLGESAAETIERRQSLQDAFGAHQDAVVALAFLRGIDLDAQPRPTALAVQDLIGFTRARAEDIGGVLRETERLRTD